MIYQLMKEIGSDKVCNNQILRLEDMACIPYDPANTDYENFKAQVNADESQIEYADGGFMSPEEAKAYVATLPQDK